MSKTKLLFIPFLTISFLTGCGAPDPGPSYNITYLNLSGSTTDNPTSYKTVDAFSLKDPTDHGYKFTGWHIDNAEGELITEIKRGMKGDLKLYATWGIPNVYSINYTNLNGSTTTNPTSYTISDSFTLSAPTDHGYQFTYWRLNDGTGFPVSEIKKGTVGDLTLFAAWGNVNTYSITYKNVSDVEFENPKEYDVEEEVKLNNPTTFKKGYNAFGGWYFDEAFTEPANNGWMPGSHYGNLTLYAKWDDPIVYNITYLNVEEGGHTNPKTYTADDEITLTVGYKLGYTFVNWLKGDESGAQITKIEKGTTGDLTLYCHFTATTYSITYHNLGVAKTDNPTKFVYDTGVNELHDPTESGYEFLGWRLGGEGGQFITSIEPFKHPGNLDIYASWGQKAKTFNIEYDLWGGTVEGGDNPTTYTIEDEVILKAPTQEGFTFTGWYLDKYKYDFFNQDRIPQKTVGNLKLYAGWKSSTTTLEQCSWNEINEIANTKKEAAKYFDIGDKKTTPIGMYSIIHEVRIIGFHHDKLTNSGNNEDSYAEITFEFVNLLTSGSPPSFLQLYSVYWGETWCNLYDQSYIFGKANDVYNDELKDGELKSVIKAVDKNAQGGTYSVKLFPLAVAEVSKNRAQSIDNEGEIYAFYKLNPSLTKFFDNRSTGYCLRSAHKTLPQESYYVDCYGQINFRTKNYSGADDGFAPGFCI